MRRAAKFGLIASLVLVGAMTGIGRAPAAQSSKIDAPAAYCAQVINDDETRNIPASLIARARQAFGLNEHADDDYVRKSTVWRCMDSRAWICNYGANLPCWKGDISRISKGGDAFCAENPDFDAIPMAATGHGTIYRWTCRGRKAVLEDQPFSIDGRGFIAEFWKPI